MVMIQKSGVEEQMKFVTRQNEIEIEHRHVIIKRNTIKICLPKKLTKTNSPNTENNNE